MRFELKVLRSTNGDIVTRQFEATDVDDAIAQGKAEGYVVLSARRRHLWRWPQRNSRRGRFPLVLFSQELLVLLNAGLPLVEALDTLADKERRNAVKRIMLQIGSDLREGRPFSAALERHPTIFPPIYVGTVRASETTGNVGEALLRYVAYQTKLDALREKVVSASIYPLLLVGLGTLICIFLLVYVVPSFTRIYEDLGSNLPLVSRWLLQWGRLLEMHGVSTLIALAAAIGAVGYGLQRPATREWLSASLWKLPAIGERIRIYHLARFYRMVGLLLRGGTAVVPALDMAAGLLHPVLRGPLEKARKRISEGRGISQSLDQEGLTTAVALRMLAIGERSGAMGDMMEQIALFHDEELTHWIDRFMRLFEPLLMTIMGLVIGAIVILLYLPIFELAASIQ